MFGAFPFRMKRKICILCFRREERVVLLGEELGKLFLGSYLLGSLGADHPGFQSFLLEFENVCIGMSAAGFSEGLLAIVWKTSLRGLM